MSTVPKMYTVVGPNGELGDLAIWPEGKEPKRADTPADADPTMRPSTPENIARAARLLEERIKAKRASGNDSTT